MYCNATAPQILIERDSINIGIVKSNSMQYLFTFMLINHINAYGQLNNTYVVYKIYISLFIETLCI